ncbi:MAG: rhamnogalacturonan lyase [Kiritimatiellae bacterium]|nr:rhamnogalacturonan lyase [Kiritimatiellia bacterium]
MKVAASILTPLLLVAGVFAQTPERLGRGVAAVRKTGREVFISWRRLAADPPDAAFHLFRDGRRLTAEPVTNRYWFLDTDATGGTYAVQRLGEPRTATFTLPHDAPIGYLRIPIDRPPDGTTPLGEPYSYQAVKASVGDFTGDGEFEIALLWFPSNARDNSQEGYTGNVYLDGYTLTGKRLWRIDFGKNIRAGNHYVQPLVFDLDGDGAAEIIVRTADGTRDGTGKAIGDPETDFRSPGETVIRGRNPDGTPRKRFVKQGRPFGEQEFVTVFSGTNGAALASVPYLPPRGEIRAWGDDYGNRCDRFLACIAYLDGRHPSAVLCRGYYTRSVLAAFDWDGNALTNRWVFDTDDPRWTAYAGQGNHNIQVADVDGDGCDEIIYGSMAVDHDGQGLYTTGLGHGDRLNLTRFFPEDPRFQVWQCHETGGNGVSFRDAATGKILFQWKDKRDIDPAIAADLDPAHPGLELWAHGLGLFNLKGERIAIPKKSMINQVVWWDGDKLREILEPTRISKYNPATRDFDPILTFEGLNPPHRGKAMPCLLGDILGDWREEIIWRENDNRSLRLYLSTEPTPHPLTTLAEDHVYRLGLAHFWICYPVPPYPSFYLGE